MAGGRGIRGAIAVLVFLGLLSLVVPPLLPFAHDAIDLPASHLPPGGSHPLGTDALGRDVLARVLHGMRVSFLVGLVAAGAALVIGVPYGAASGYFGGRLGGAMMRLVDILYGVPLLLVVSLLAAFLGGGLSSVFLALGLVYWLETARIVRAEVLSLKQREFVLAARLAGAGPWRIILRHMIPNAAGPIVVSLGFVVPQAVFAEAFLSFLGLGVRAPAASLGSLVAAGYDSIRVAPWELLFPAAAISVIIIAFNLLSDGLRDAYDPRAARYSPRATRYSPRAEGGRG